MTKSRTTQYHAAGNGRTERFNRTLLGMLGTVELSKKGDRKSFVGPLVHAYNSTRNESTHFLPFYSMFEHEPRLAIDAVLGLATPGTADHNYGKYMADLKSKLKQSYELTSINADNSRKRHKK